MKEAVFLVSVVALIAAGLATYWKGQAALAKQLFDKMESEDEKVKAELREEARERRAETDGRLHDHEQRLRVLEGKR